MPDQTHSGFRSLRTATICALLLTVSVLITACRGSVERTVDLAPGSGPQPGDPQHHAYFGHSLAADGDLAIVGAYGNAARADNAGAAYIFRRTPSGWDQEARLAPLSLRRNDQFGISVAIHGQYALVGARGDIEKAPATGYAVFYRRFADEGSWNPIRTVRTRDPLAADHFGLATAIHGNWAAVGAYGDPAEGRDAGAIYLYHLADGVWQYHTTLRAPDAAESDYFGFSVALDDTRLVAGAFGDDDKGNRSGAAYIFARTGTTWSFESKLVAPDGGRHELLGHSVAIAGNTVIAGAHGHKAHGRFSGAAYVFIRGTRGWTLLKKLEAPDGTANQYFGFSVAAASNRFLVGARGDGPDQAGSAYLFARSGNRIGLTAKLRVSKFAAFDFFGRAVALTEAFGLVGAHGRDTAGSMSGAVYAF